MQTQAAEGRRVPLAFGKPDIDTVASEKLFYGIGLRLNQEYTSEPLRKYVQREVFNQIRRELPSASILPIAGREATSTLSVLNKGVNIVEVYLFNNHDGGKTLRVVVHGHPIMKGVAYAIQNSASVLESKTRRELIVLMNHSSRLPELEGHKSLGN